MNRVDARWFAARCGYKSGMLIDRIRSMEVFTHVVEQGCLAGAADALQMSTQDVEEALRALEAHLGVRLWHGRRQRAGLTEEGLAYLRRIGPLLAEMGAVEAALKREVETPGGQLRVDMSASFARHVIAPALPEFLLRHPGMVLELSSSGDGVADLLREGYDCGVYGEWPRHEALSSKLIGWLPIITCAAPSYLDRFGVPENLQDLARHKFVNLRQPGDGILVPFHFSRDDRVLHVVEGDHWVACTDPETYVAAAVAGLGLMQGPRTRPLAAHLASGRLVPVLTPWAPASVPVVLVTPATVRPPARVRVFAEWVGTLFRADSLGPPPP